MIGAHRRDSETVVIRVDSSNQMGSGHLVRCHTLARELRSRGKTVHFVCRAHAGTMSAVVRADQFQVTELPRSEAARTAVDHTLAGHSQWLGVPWDTDAEETVRAFEGTHPQWMIVDHYALGQNWERAVRPFVDRVLVIDDLADRSHDADVILDQNWFGEQTNRRYDGLVSIGTTELLGPQYGLLRPEFAAVRQKLSTRTDHIRRVFVYFGGADPDDITGLALRALSAPSLRFLDVDVVVGTMYQYGAALRRLAEQRGRTTIHSPRPHLADLMAISDCAIGAGGATTWERMCLGLSSLVITTAVNQEPISACLHNAGLITLVGRGGAVTVEDLRAALERRIAIGGFSETSLALMQMCDGLGTSRVADVIASVSRSTSEDHVA